MKAQITEKIDSKTIQLAWGGKFTHNIKDEVLYLETKNYPDGRRIYTLNLTPEPTHAFQPFEQSDEFKLFNFPKGLVHNSYGPAGIKKQLQDNRAVINRNIEYLNRLLEVVDYIEMMEDESNLDVIEKWEKSGLLHGLEKEQKSELAVFFERTAIYLISEEESLEKKVDMSDQKDFAASKSCIFPVIRKIYILIDDNGKNYKNFSSLVDYKELIRDFSDKYEDFDKKRVSLEIEDPYTDLEAKFLVEYCENYIKNFKDGGRK